MWPVFKTDRVSGFKIVNYVYGRPLNIMHDNLYLSSADEKNMVDFYFIDDNKGKQKWIIEESEDNDSTVYIGATQPNKYGEKYLGAPNSDNSVFLYTSKTKHTKWRITKVEKNSTYDIVYVGEKFNPMTHTIVVARYNENLDWLMPYNDSVVVFNKGENNIPQFKNIKTLKNTGREGDTYLRYIINNYENLPDKITFLQGDSFSHNSTILYGIDNYEKTLHFQPLGIRWTSLPQIPPAMIIQEYQTITTYGLRYLVINVGLNLEYLDRYYFEDKDLVNVQNDYLQYYKLTDENTIISHFLKRIGYPGFFPHILEYSWSALFSATKTNILKNSHLLYKNICHELTKDFPDGGPNGYVLEKLWHLLLSDKKFIS
jgi:hypothetical protein